MTTIHERQAPSELTERAPVDAATRRLLICAVIAAVLFVGASLVQAVTRPGFDLARQPLSLLLLGDLGWIQFINFELVGVLAIASAVGVRRGLHPGPAGTWGPMLIGAWGAGLIIAGLFRPDPSMGFPPGAPAGNPPAMSIHSMVHGIGFFVSLASLVAACLVFTRRFVAHGQRWWAAYCVATAVAAPLFVLLSGLMMRAGRGGIPLFGLAIVMSLWLALITARLLAV